MHAGRDGAVSFAVEPPFLRRMQQLLETGTGSGQDLPLDIEALLCAAAIVVVLRRPTTADAGRRRLRWAAAVLTALSVASVLDDALSQLPVPYLAQVWLSDVVQGGIVVTGCMRHRRRRSGPAWPSARPGPV